MAEDLIGSRSEARRPSVRTPEVLKQVVKAWLDEKRCSVCAVRLGLNSMKQKKLYCQFCFHAICAKCTTPNVLFSPLARRRACSRCTGGDESLRETLRTSDLQRGDVSEESDRSLPADGEAARKSEETALMDAVLSTARELSESMANSPCNTLPGDTELVDCSRQIRCQEEEIQALKEQHTQLLQDIGQRDEQIRALAEKVGGLTRVNTELLRKTQEMEQKVSQPVPKSSESCCQTCEIQ